MGMEITEQQKEIEQLNERYKTALRDKVDVYDEFVECIKELINRNARFMKNELEICRLTNESAVMKRELEQKEKTIEEFNKKIKTHPGADKEFMTRLN